MLTMTEYKLQANKLEPRMCTKHTQLPYSMGCRVCFQVNCVKCVKEMKACVNGERLFINAC